MQFNVKGGERAQGERKFKGRESSKISYPSKGEKAFKLSRERGMVKGGEQIEERKLGTKEDAWIEEDEKRKLEEEKKLLSTLE